MTAKTRKENFYSLNLPHKDKLWIIDPHIPQNDRGKFIDLINIVSKLPKTSFDLNVKHCGLIQGGKNKS